MTEPLISLSLGICWYHQDFCRGMFMLPEWYRSTALFVFPSLMLPDQYWPVWAAPAVDHSPLFPVALTVDETMCFTKNFLKALTRSVLLFCQCYPWPSVCPWIQESLTCWFCGRSDLWLLHLNQLWGQLWLLREKEQHKHRVMSLWSTHSAIRNLSPKDFLTQPLCLISCLRFLLH